MSVKIHVDKMHEIGYNEVVQTDPGRFVFTPPSTISYCGQSALFKSDDPSVWTTGGLFLKGAFCMEGRDGKGQFKKGHRASPSTEFKKGQHWRQPKPYWDRDWLYHEYIVRQRSAADIASAFGCNENNILYFLRKHHIKTRTVSEARTVKHWGSPGEQNGMYGIVGQDNPNWKGGITPERQLLYSSSEWKRSYLFVWERDRSTCQRCEKHIEKRDGYVLYVHHIVPFSCEHLRTDRENLILLCTKCHGWVHSKKNTEKEFICGC